MGHRCFDKLSMSRHDCLPAMASPLASPGFQLGSRRPALMPIGTAMTRNTVRPAEPAQVPPLL